MSYLIAGVVVMAVIAILVGVTGRKKSGSSNKNKSQSQIIKEANKRLAKDPHDPQGLIPLGDIYYKSHLWEKAAGVYNQLSRMAADNVNIDTFQANLRDGVCSLKLGKIPESIQSLGIAYKLNPSDYDVNYYLGQAFFQAKAFDKAIPCLKKALTLNPEASGIYVILGECLYNIKRYKDALPCFKKALDEDPGNKEALYCMADAMMEEGHGDKAIKVFSHLRADPVYGARSSLMAGLYHTKLNDLEKAIQDFEIGLKHETILPEIKLELQYRLAQCYFSINQINKGLVLLKAIRTVNLNYKDVNGLISRYQELSQNSNLQVYLTSNSTDFVGLCRKIIAVKWKNASIKIQDINVGPMYTDILAEIGTAKWEDLELFRFFRTNGATGEIYVRDFHGTIQDLKADRGFCISAGVFSEESHKYTEGRPIDLIEKTELTKILKMIS